MSPLLPTLTSSSPIKKCTVTRGILPFYTSPAQPPTKRKPLATLSNLQWLHQLDIVYPTALVDLIHAHLARQLSSLPNRGNVPAVKYAKAHLTLSDILTGDFFNIHVKAGNVALLSEGRAGIDQVYSLRSGILTLQLPQDVYRRTGLTGNPIGAKHKSKNPFYKVSLDLRLPSMVKGRKGFERLLRAAREVLSARRVWVFVDLADAALRGTKRNAEGDVKQESEDPLNTFHPLWCTAASVSHSLTDTMIPSVLERRVWDLSPSKSSSESMVSAAPTLSHNELEELEEVLEWIALVALGSPRVKAGDTADPYICRYEIPGKDIAAEGGHLWRGGDLTRLQWTGFLECERFVLGCILALKAALEEAGGDGSGKEEVGSKQKQKEKGGLWASVAMHGVDGDEVTLLLKHQRPAAEPQQGTAEHSAGGSPTDKESMEVDDRSGSPEQIHENNHSETKPGKRTESTRQGPKLSSVAFIEWYHRR